VSALTRIRKSVGAEGEKLAREHLAANGYEILDANWRCKAGELDIVAMKDGTLAIVEVRTRSAASSHLFGAPEESVDRRKRAKLRVLAELYMQQTGRRNLPVRFDVIAVTLHGNTAEANIRHIVSAL
jgi:putative endonuclease